MNSKRNIKSNSFNFRLRPKEMQQLRNLVFELDYISIAQFIRDAIKEKISRVVLNAK